MKIDEFIEKHADEEMAKLQRLRDQGQDPHAPEEKKINKPSARNGSATRMTYHK